MTEKIFEKALKRVIHFFEEHSIKYALVGAWANNIWGRPRGTADIDILILIPEIDFESFKNELQNKANFSIDEAWNKYNPMIRHIQSRFIFKKIPIDIMLPRDKHDAEILNRRKKIKILNSNIYVSSIEDTIIQKIKIGRPRDFEDAASVLKKHKKNLDLKYLNKWANILNLSDKLNWLLENF